MTPAPLDLLALAYIVEQYAEDLPIIAIRFPGESDTELRVRLSKWRGAPAESVAEHAASLENYMPPRCTRQEEVMASMRQVDKTRASKAVGEYKEKPTEASGRMVPCSKSQWHSFHPASEDCKECDPPKLTLAKLPQEYPTPEDCLYVDVLSGTVHDTYLMSKRWMRNSAQHVPLSSIKPGTVEAKRVWLRLCALHLCPVQARRGRRNESLLLSEGCRRLSVDEATLGGIMEFEAFKKIARIEKLSNKVIITEKIDGTNAQVAFDDEGKMWVGSRNRWLVPQTAEVPKGSDNFGFAEWCRENEDELRKLGKGRHYGEWFGRGIGPHGYGLTDRRFALFNTRRWGNPDQVLPACVEVVPVLFEGVAGSVQELVEELLLGLAKHGSRAVPGFREPEGVVAYLPALDLNFKSLLYGSRGGAKKHPSPIESIPEATK